MLNYNLLITGASGLVGRSLSKKIQELNLYNEIVCFDSKRCDLRNRTEVEDEFRGLELGPTWDCIHLSARVGGLNANMLNNADFFSDNVLMNTNVLDFCHFLKIGKLLSFASTCVYPENAIQPYREYSLHDGWPHNTNFGYAFSKRMLDIQSRAYREQYGHNFVVAVPTNIYGPEDDFTLDKAHVIPDIIHKLYLANVQNKPEIELWGDGLQLRDFIYVDDISDAIITIMDKYNKKEPINIATGNDVTIKYVVQLIKSEIGYNGNIKWSNDKKGVHKKSVDNAKIKTLGWTQKISIEEGIKRTCKWFVEHYPNVRR